MSTKIKLGNTPKTFVRTIEIVNINGGTDAINITYKYRTRLQYAELVDQQIAAAKTLAESTAPDDAAPKTVVERVSADDAAGADAVLQIAEGWDLDDEFNAANLAQLEDENPGALYAITLAYRAALLDARVKN